MTLNELLGENYVPGSMKVRCSSWGAEAYMIFYFKDSCGNWYGLNSEGTSNAFGSDGPATDWEEYKEPLYSITELVEQELDFIPGKLKLLSNSTIFYPYFLDEDNDWIGHNENKQHAVWNPNAKEWKVCP